MCGIVAAISSSDCVTEVLIAGLKRLEYRGYDSAGIALLNTKKEFQLKRTQGKVSDLEKSLSGEFFTGHSGIAHTRWATHGIPTERNAHPHLSFDLIAIVHNGIIENHKILREKLQKLDYTFQSETDSELIAHLIHFYYMQEKDFRKAVQLAVGEMEGAYAIAIMNKAEPDRLIAVKKGAPLVLGLGENARYIASDHIALQPKVKEFIYLEEGDLADLQYNMISIYDRNGCLTQREIKTPIYEEASLDKAGFSHYMLKEIHEQPAAVKATLAPFFQGDIICGQFSEQKNLLNQIKRFHIIACGTSYHAGLVAKYWIEDLLGLPCHVEVASEYRYRKIVVEPDTLFLSISQSGETADTLAALQKAKTAGYLSTMALSNVAGSAIVRGSDLHLLTYAGVEIGVASTKAFVTQLVALFAFTLELAKMRSLLKDEFENIVALLKSLPHHLNRLLLLSENIEAIAPLFQETEHALFLGRGINYPIAMEGALKLKEISYIHAEAYPSGELKHGPLALVDKKMPVIAVVPKDTLVEKLRSNLHEVQARGGRLIVFAEETLSFSPEEAELCISIPSFDPIFSPLTYTVPLQLLAYCVALLRGTDVDKPRNLAKSVTVE